MKSSIFEATPQNFPSMSRLISYLGENKVLMWWMDAHGPKQSSCWYFWPPSAKNVTLQKWEHEIVWPNYRPNCQKNAIEPQRRHIPSDWRPRYRQFGVDCCTYWQSDIVVETLRRLWKFWFYSSLCENGMSSKHKLNNQHVRLHSLVHTLAGLNEIQHPTAQLQELLYLIWFWRLSQHRKIYCKFTNPQRNDPLADT